MSQALGTNIDASQTCKVNKAILLSTAAFELEKIPSCTPYWANVHPPLLGKYLFAAGSLKLPHCAHSTAATASARRTPLSETSHRDSKDSARDGGNTAEIELDGQVSHRSGNEELVVKMFACVYH